MTASVLTVLYIFSIDQTDFCVISYPDHVNDYISNNKNDSAVYYLGDKTSEIKCIASCLDFNYLCDKSTVNSFIYGDSTFEWQFDNATCTVESSHSGTDNDYGSFALLTTDLTANEYIIDLEVTILSGRNAGIMFKAQQDPDYNYYVALDLAHTVPVLSIGTYRKNASFKIICACSLAGIVNQTLGNNTKYSLSVHVNHNTFTTYFDGQQVGDVVSVNESLWIGNYAGLFVWRAHAIFHSFKVRFPNVNDNEDEKICRSYMYDKNTGECYGYYGNDYAMVRDSTFMDTTKTYDAGLVNESCDYQYLIDRGFGPILTVNISDLAIPSPTENYSEIMAETTDIPELDVVEGLETDSKKGYWVIAIVVVGILIICFVALWIFWRSRKKKNADIPVQDTREAVMSISSVSGIQHVVEQKHDENPENEKGADMNVEVKEYVTPRPPPRISKPAKNGENDGEKETAGNGEMDGNRDALPSLGGHEGNSTVTKQ